jgi:hypothetical protein
LFLKNLLIRLSQNFLMNQKYPSFQYYHLNLMNQHFLMFLKNHLFLLNLCFLMNQNFRLNQNFPMSHYFLMFLNYLKNHYYQ